MQPEPIVIGQPAQMQASQFPEGAVFIQKQSSAPSTIGILMIIAGVFGVFGGAWGLITAQDTIALLDELNEDLEIQIDIPAWYIWLKPVVQLVSGIALIAGGYFLHQRKKIGVFIGLGAMVISAAFAVLESSAMSSVYESLDFPGAGTAALIGLGVTLFCNAICGLIIAIPLMSNTSNLE